MEPQLESPQENIQSENQEDLRRKSKLLKPLLVILGAVIIIGGMGLGIFLWQNQKNRPQENLSGADQTKTNQEDQKVYNNTEFGFSISYPKEYKIVEDSKDFVSVVNSIEQPKCPSGTKCLDGSIEDQILWIRVIPSNGLDLDNSYKETNLFKQNTLIRKKEIVKVAGFDSQKITFCEGKTAASQTCDQDLPPEYAVLHNGYFYYFSTFEPGKVDKGEAIIQTLKFTK